MELFVALIAGHFLGDFVLQSKKMVKKKIAPLCLLFHIAIITIITWLLLGTGNLYIILWVFYSHFIIDWAKVVIAKNSLTAFVIDQIAHLLSLSLIAFLFKEEKTGYIWIKLGLFNDLKTYLEILITLTGGIISTKVGEIVIRYIIKEINYNEKNEVSGINNAGAIIGNLERAICYIFIILGQPTAIAFMMTAKSILRFGDVRTNKDRKHTEYIILGTFASFAWAITMAALTAYALKQITLQN